MQIIKGETLSACMNLKITVSDCNIFPLVNIALSHTSGKVMRFARLWFLSSECQMLTVHFPRPANSVWCEVLSNVLFLSFLLVAFIICFVVVSSFTSLFFINFSFFYYTSFFSHVPFLLYLCYSLFYSFHFVSILFPLPFLTSVCISSFPSFLPLFYFIYLFGFLSYFTLSTFLFLPLYSFFHYSLVYSLPLLSYFFINFLYVPSKIFIPSL